MRVSVGIDLGSSRVKLLSLDEEGNALGVTMASYATESRQPGYAEQNLAHKPDLVVIGNAISRGNPEAEYVLDHRLTYCSLPELLKEQENQKKQKK